MDYFLEGMKQCKERGASAAASGVERPHDLALEGMPFSTEDMYEAAETFGRMVATGELELPSLVTTVAIAAVLAERLRVREERTDGP